MDLEGIKVGEKHINNIRYAGDTALVAETEEKLQTLVQALVHACGERGLKMSVSKIKVMVVAKGDDNIESNITVNGVVSEQVEKYKYLGSVATRDGRRLEEIKTRIAITKNAFIKIKHLVTNRSI